MLITWEMTIRTSGSHIDGRKPNVESSSLMKLSCCVSDTIQVQEW